MSPRLGLERLACRLFVSASTHGMLLSSAPLAALIAGGAGARPDHSIRRHAVCCSARVRFWHLADIPLRPIADIVMQEMVLATGARSSPLEVSVIARVAPIEEGSPGAPLRMGTHLRG